MPQINEQYRQLDRSPAALRRFGWTVGGVLLVLGALLLWRARVAGWPVLIVGAAVLLAALIAPGVLKHFHRVWMTIALVMGWIMTNVILTIVFFAVLTPIGLLQRLFARPTVDLALKPGAASYWEKRAGGQPAPADYEKQF
jgi:hypothetical protein